MIILKSKSCCFFGHREIDETDKLTKRITQAVEFLIREKGVTYVYFGSKSKFNDLCFEVVTDLKEKYPDIKRIYVRSAFPDINDSYKNYVARHYSH